MEILVKDQNFEKNRNYGVQEPTFWSKIEMLVKNQNFGKNLGQKSQYWSKIETLVKNRLFGEKFKFW